MRTSVSPPAPVRPPPPPLPARPPPPSLPPLVRSAAELLAHIRRGGAGFLTHPELNRLAQLANLPRLPPDLRRDATNALALAVRSFVRLKAVAYAAEFDCAGDRDELAAVGWGQLPLAVRNYRVEAGGFLNYFAFAASREMRKAARKARRRLERLRTDARPWQTPDDLPDPHVVAVRDALATLSREARQLVERVHGFRGPRLSIEDAGVTLGLDRKTAIRRYRRAKARLALALAADLGRPDPEPELDP